MFHFSQIIATGSYVPPRIVTNKDLEPLLNTQDSWINEKIGIEERRYVSIGVGTSDLAVEAARNALVQAQLKPTDLDCIILATSTPDYQSPGAGVLVQEKLGCHKIPAFDIHNTSPGFVFALELGDSLIKSGKYQTILVVGAEVHSTALDMSEKGRLMSVIFGDGAGAVILKPTESPHHIISTKLHSEGKHAQKLWCEAPASLYHPWISPALIAEGRTHPTMDGRHVFEHAVNYMSLVSEELLIEQEITTEEINWVIPHQANKRIINAIAQRLNVPLSKVALTIQKYGNTSSASIPITLDEVNRAHKLQKNDLILIMSFGSGYSWGAALIRW